MNRLIFESSADGPLVEFALTSVASVEKVGGKRRAGGDFQYRLDIQSKCIFCIFFYFYVYIFSFFSFSFSSVPFFE